MPAFLIKIRAISLFGMFNHEIEIKHDEKITIITAPNGFGKTAILKLTNAFFYGSYWEYFKTGFRSFTLEFSDGTLISIDKQNNSTQSSLFSETELGNLGSDEVPRPRIDLTMQAPREEEKRWQMAVAPPVSLASIERHIPYLERVAARSWLDLRTGRRLSLEEVSVLYADEMPNDKRSREPEWLRTFRTSLECRFIETQRLLRISPLTSSAARRPMREPDSYLRPVVSELASELSEGIKSKLTEYAALSQTLDSTFPQRLIAEAGRERLSEATLRSRLADLDGERSKLMEAGLLDRDEALQLSSDKISTAVLDVLAVYINDTEKKLNVFNDIYQKIDVLRRIVNTRFQYKSLYVNKTSGFGIRLYDGSDLPLDGLSSGEQHELVLFYELLFDVKPNSLILIDEPELSLHVAWQKEFIRDLESIIDLSHFYAIVATHSPQIINDRWDLTIGLEGPPG